ncbi:MAG: response regulator [Gammaproteobacteria bacterium]|nr:response regulator [Gammaproteobacteria bacterium]MDH5652975.1 response regulator [Gammaproteobacteria bacterium]
METRIEQDITHTAPPALPWYHPVTAVLIDDNESFLYNLTLQIDDDLAFKLFTSPLEALQYINSTAKQNPGEDDYEISLPYADIATLKTHLTQPRRFKSCPVVVVDYSMPSMDGLTFCRNLQQTEIKKILLTATMEQGAAIQAFNSGLIDRFISKHEPDWIEKLNHHIRQCQYSYFAELGKPLLKQLDADDYAYMNMAEFQAVFDTLCAKYKVIEYYLAASPGGYFMLSEQQHMRLIIVRQEEISQPANNTSRFLIPYSRLAYTDYYYALIDETGIETTEAISRYSDYISLLDQALLDQHE